MTALQITKPNVIVWLKKNTNKHNNNAIENAIKDPIKDGN